MTLNSLSIVICSYNRAAFLRETLAACGRLNPPDECAVEILVVDNNSDDDTPFVVEQASRGSRYPVRYLFEERQGKSYALNLALNQASGDVLALTDDDVVPSRDWLERIAWVFRNDDVTFCFGKVLPRWSVLPPAELLTERARQIWGPLAILDYGEQSVRYLPDVPGDQRLPIGANLALGREVLLEIGGWRTDLGKVDNTLISGEDHELFLRLKRLDQYRGVYDPANTVRHFVPAARLTRRYFRRWFYWHGKTLARMSHDLYGGTLDLARVPHIVGVPRFLYRQFGEQCWKWARHLGRRDALELLINELMTIEHIGFFAQKWQNAITRGRPAGPPPPPVRPIPTEPTQTAQRVRA